MSRLKFAAIELFVTGLYAIFAIAAVRTCLLLWEAGLLEGRRSGSIALPILSLPPWLSGYAYRMIVGVVPSYTVTWRMGLLLTIANGLLLEASGWRQSLYESWANYYPMQKWGLIALICLASLAITAGLFRVGTHIWKLPGFTRRKKNQK